MSEKQCGITGKDRILDHLIDVSDIKMPLHHGDQGLDDLYVLVGVFNTVLTSTQRWWEFLEVMLGLPLLLCFLSFQLSR